MIVLILIYFAGSVAFLFGAAKYLAEWKKPAEERVEYRTIEKPVKVPVEKEHVRCLQCMHGTRDQGQTGRVYCRRFGFHMMPKAYCSMAEMNTNMVVRDKVQEAERLLDKSDDLMRKYREAMELQSAYDAYQSTFEHELSARAVRAELDDMKKQYSRVLSDIVKWR